MAGCSVTGCINSEEEVNRWQRGAGGSTR